MEKCIETLEEYGISKALNTDKLDDGDQDELEEEGSKVLPNTEL